MTATILEEEVDTDITHLLDFLQAPQCEIKEHAPGQDECLEAAEFKLVLSCCAEMWLLCEDHMLLAVSEFKKLRIPVHASELGGCGAENVSFAIIERL